MQKEVSVKPLPFFFVGEDLTKERVDNYLAKKHVLLSQAIGKPDTKSIWYSKEHIMKLLEEIDYAGGDGIRIYFGTYEKGHEYEGQTCLLMKTTREKKIGEEIIHVNVVLEKEVDYPERSKTPRDIITFPDDDTDASGKKDFNFGSPCPPRCDPPPYDYE